MEKNTYDRSRRPPYRGRFAPTPSGPLHLGSLLTALAGWLQARSQQGVWRIRIDDLDRPRCVPGSAEQILCQLAAHGLNWDEAPRYQSAHIPEYVAALNRLQALDVVYPCTCTRAELVRNSLSGPDGSVYAGTCRAGSLVTERQTLRLRLQSGRWCLDDAWQGRQCRELESEVGDFAVWRSDGQPGYQLACVIDEAAQGITEVVRGADLLGSSLRQSCLQALLALPSPAYRHLPVLTDRAGHKLSKQNHARAIESADAGENLWRCLRLLRQEPPAELRLATPARVLEWAALHWRPEAFAGRLSETLEE